MKCALCCILGQCPAEMRWLCCQTPNNEQKENILPKDSPRQKPINERKEVIAPKSIPGTGTVNKIFINQRMKLLMTCICYAILLTFNYFKRFGYKWCYKRC